MGWSSPIFSDDFTAVANNYSAFFAPGSNYIQRWEEWDSDDKGPEMVATGNGKLSLSLPFSTGAHITGAVSKEGVQIFNLDSNPNNRTGPSGGIERNQWIVVCDFFGTGRLAPGNHLGVFMRYNDKGGGNITRIGCAIQTSGTSNCGPLKITDGCPGSGNLFLQFTSFKSQNPSQWETRFCCFTATNPFDHPTDKYRIQIEEWEQPLGTVWPFVWKLHWKACLIWVTDPPQPLECTETDEDQITAHGLAIPDLTGSELAFGFGPVVSTSDPNTVEIDFVGSASWQYT